MRSAMWCLALGLTACESSGGSDELSGGTIVYEVDGVDYTESTDVSAQWDGAFLSIGWNSTSGGDLGPDFYGSLTITSAPVSGSYAPVKRSSDVDAVINIAGDDGSISYYPLGNEGQGDGSIEIDSIGPVGAKGSFSFTGGLAVASDAEPEVQISGTFDVTFAATEGDEG